MAQSHGNFEGNDNLRLFRPYLQQVEQVELPPNPSQSADSAIQQHPALLLSAITSTGGRMNHIPLQTASSTIPQQRYHPPITSNAMSRPIYNLSSQHDIYAAFQSADSAIQHPAPLLSAVTSTGGCMNHIPLQTVSSRIPQQQYHPSITSDAMSRPIYNSSSQHHTHTASQLADSAMQQYPAPLLSGITSTGERMNHIPLQTAPSTILQQQYHSPITSNAMSRPIYNLSSQQNTYAGPPYEQTVTQNPVWLSPTSQYPIFQPTAQYPILQPFCQHPLLIPPSTNIRKYPSSFAYDNNMLHPSYMQYEPTPNLNQRLSPSIVFNTLTQWLQPNNSDHENETVLYLFQAFLNKERRKKRRENFRGRSRGRRARY